jgi:pepF/M3 family oligoendopeptidase
MSVEEEDLAADLARSGADAWGRLQEALSANLKTEWEEGVEKTVVQLRSLAFDPSRSIREKAFRSELALWESARVPLAFALNGVKGHSISVDGRRGYQSTLEKSWEQNRITGTALQTMIDVMTESLPLFRRYLGAKARALGLPRLAFFDLFAPISGEGRSWTFAEGREFIAEQFGDFSAGLEEFAELAFSGQWIDAEPREGKVGGAYCMGVPDRKESRVLCNFDGSFSSITTLAHELGHAYHHHILRDASNIHRDYPMTLAETASIFAENLLVEGAIKKLQKQEQAGVLEAFLADSTQVVVDILSRYLFENQLFQRRTQGDLSPDDLCALMLDAQKKTYGDALDPDHLHPYMWAVKGHYYSQGYAFYNYPYAFGLLFGLGLLRLYREEGRDFVSRYDQILINTGRLDAGALTREAGFDIEDRSFWDGSIEMIRERVIQFEDAVAGP